MSKHQSKTDFSHSIQIEQWGTIPQLLWSWRRIIYNRLQSCTKEAFTFICIFCDNSKKLIAWLPLMTPLIQKLFLIIPNQEGEGRVCGSRLVSGLSSLSTETWRVLLWVTIICSPGLWLSGNDFAPLGCFPQQAPAHPDSAAQGSRPDPGGQRLQNSSALGSTGEPPPPFHQAAAWAELGIAEYSILQKQWFSCEMRKMDGRNAHERPQHFASGQGSRIQCLLWKAKHGPYRLSTVALNKSYDLSHWDHVYASCWTHALSFSLNQGCRNQQLK